MTATPRLGARDSSHPKGYAPGQTVLLRVFNARNIECLRQSARIEGVITRPLRALTPQDLHGAVLYRVWQDVQTTLSFFEKRYVEEDEDVSVITFSYL